MIIFIRGHIRNSFCDNKLYNLIKELSKIPNSNLKIYIHTWSIINSSLSWRKVDANEIKVTEEMIKDYFMQLKSLIKNIIIEDDKQIKLIGNTEGKIGKGPCPLLAWKNMWHGKHKGLESINEDPDEILVNLRFDLFCNSNNARPELITKFINFNINKKEILTKNYFINEKESFGIDNIYIGNLKTMKELTNHFYLNLDEILIKYPDIVHQEFLVFKENNLLFKK
jgi:hypothetical protein